ncbi:hypothetical protein, partial [Streptomyces sp. CT34]|uniref:hypothetical protein n=1 Tax=Streptomyces sp. CT34 TaxID=1553907 RepID=UPI0018E30179
MMRWDFLTWLGSFVSGTAAYRKEDVEKNLERLREVLAKEKQIRVFVGSGPGQGHQVAGVRLLDRLFSPPEGKVPGLGYKKLATVLYEEGTGHAAGTAEKLRKLLRWSAGQNKGKYKGGDVELVKWDGATPPTPQVAFGLSAACDREMKPSQLNVGYYLQVQPFQWTLGPDDLWIGEQRFPLGQQPELGGATFRQRAMQLSVPDISDFNWTPYTDSSDETSRRQAEALKALVQRVHPPKGTGTCALLTTYGIRTRFDRDNRSIGNPLSSAPYEQVVLLTTGVLATQRTPAGATHKGALPVVIVNLDEFWWDDSEGEEADKAPAKHFDPVRRLLAGGQVKWERLDPDTDRANRARWVRKGYLTDKAKASFRVKFWDVCTGASLADSLNWLTTGDQWVPAGQKVLWAQVGRVPPELFDYLLRCSTCPPVFEGANTTALALNFGSMYYRVNGEVSGVAPGTVLYPTTSLAANPRRHHLTELQAAADQMRNYLRLWSEQNRPPDIFAKPILAYREEGGGSGTYHDYFRGVADFYRSPANDKINLALAYLAQRHAEQPRPQVRAGRAAPEAPLEALHRELLQALKNSTLLLAESFPGRWRAFLGTLVGSGPVTLQQAAIVREPAGGEGAITKITVTGTGIDFPHHPHITLVFTAPGGFVEARLSVAWQDTGGLPGLEWIQLHDLELNLAVAERPKLSHGALRTKISIDGGPTAELALPLPAPPTPWLLTASLDPKQATAGRFFNLAGGVDLTRLPAPFTHLDDLGLTALGVCYDPKKKAAESLTFTMATTKAVPLLGAIALKEIEVETTVSAPGSLADRSVATRFRGTFSIGEAVVVVAATTPEMVFSGQLTHGTVKITDLLAAFLPGVTLDGLSTPEITEFAFRHDHLGRATTVSAGLKATLTVGVFTLSNLSLLVDSVPGSRQGRVAGRLVLLPGPGQLALDVVGSHTPTTQWTFEARQTGDPVSIAKLAERYLGWKIDPAYDLQIQGLYVRLVSKTGAWELSGRTAKRWQVPFLEAAVDAAVRLASDGTTKSGRIEAGIRWQGIDITLGHDLHQKKTFLTWRGLEGTLEPGDKGDWTAVLALTETVTIGWLIEEMVSWLTGTRFGLEAPWNILDSVKLSGLKLRYTFNSKTPERAGMGFRVALDPIELGFARIDGINVDYAKGTSKQGVKVSITGSFPWNVGDSARGDSGTLGPWDASTPGDAPAPPGQGGKYLDLRLLTLGQHVTSDELKKAATVQAAIEAMAKLSGTKPGEIPEVTFDAASDWLVGADFGVLRLGGAAGANGGGASGGGGAPRTPAAEKPGYLVTLQAVFNDPSLYGLRVALDGDAAKVFKGLDFQVMYRQLSKDLGVYQAEIALPDTMRHLSVGAYSLTLPIFGVAVYTNGDFLIDVGFPKNGDWTRSFSIEGIIPPGLPMLGSGGFYFGKLPAAATPKLPAAPALGTFNPVIVFGFGLRVGFGKSVEYGVLKAGFSLTLFGVLEGIIATWNPYQALPPSQGADDRAQLQTTNYYWLQGSVGIAGKLYGSVDFAVIKAQVDVDIKLYVQMTYEAYVSLAISVLVSVEVSASVKIDLWLVSITLHFSFSLHLKETFTLPNHGKAPWLPDGQVAMGVLAGASDRRLTELRPLSAVAPGPAMLVACAVDGGGPLFPAASAVDWTRLKPADEEHKKANPLSGHLLSPLSMAADEYAPAEPARQQAVCVALLSLDSVPPAGQEQPGGAGKDSSFEVLCKRVLAWAVAAIRDDVDGKLTYDEVCAGQVTDAQLAHLLNKVLVSADDRATPIPPDAVATFLAEQFVVTVGAATEDEKAAAGKATTPKPAAVFPMPPGLRFTLPSGTSYTLDGYNTIGTGALKALRADFNKLLVQAQTEKPAPAPPSANTDAQSLSVASWVFADFFLLLARQMVQAARSGLRTFTYPLSNGATAKDARTWIAGRGGPKLHLYDVLAANAAHPLATGSGSTVTIGAICAAGAQDTFATLAEALPTTSGTTATATDLATANAGAACLRDGARIAVGDRQYTVRTGDTLLDVAGPL